MKWFVALVLALCMVTPAFAGEDPYIAIVGNDALDYNGFYFSPKYIQFLYDQTNPSFPAVCYAGLTPTPDGCEKFKAQFPINQPEVCDLSGLAGGNPNAAVMSPFKGTFEWWVRLPKAPSGQINLVLQCGVLKPNALAFYGEQAMELCAAETGEIVAPGNCVRALSDPGQQVNKPAALPMITAIAYPGPYAGFTTPFNLTAFKNPGTYSIVFDTAGAIADTAVAKQVTQILDGTAGARILLKACMDKSIVVKIPVEGQVNVKGQYEADLNQGDMIYVKMEVPRNGTVDVYCHAQSLRLQGVGVHP